MDRLTKRGLSTIFGIFIVLLVAMAWITTYAKAPSPSFNMTIISEKHDIVSHEVVVEIQNFDPASAQPFNLKFFVQNTTFNISRVSDIYISEYKPIAKDVPAYDTRIINETTGETETYQNGTVSKMVAGWKPAKMAIVNQNEKISATYGNINIPKFNADTKYDELGNAYDVGGKKRFKITWGTPVAYKTAGKGYWGVADANTGVSYDPWWDASWNKRAPIYCTELAGLARTNETISLNLENITGFSRSDTQTDCDDIRLVDSTDTAAMAFTNTTCNATSIVVEFPARSVSANAQASICAYAYWKNPSATTPAIAGSLSVTVQQVVGMLGNSWFVQYGPSFGSRIRAIDAGGVGVAGNPDGSMFQNNSGGHDFATLNTDYSGLSHFQGVGAHYLANVSAPITSFSASFNSMHGDGVEKNITYYDTGKAFLNISLRGTSIDGYRPVMVSRTYTYTPDTIFWSGGNSYVEGMMATGPTTISSANYIGMRNSTTSEYLAFIVIGNNTVFRTGGQADYLWIDTSPSKTSPNIKLWMLFGRNETGNMRTIMDTEYRKFAYPLIVSAGAAESQAVGLNASGLRTSPAVPSWGNQVQVIINVTGSPIYVALNWTWPNGTITKQANLTGNGDMWSSLNFSIDNDGGTHNINVTSCNSDFSNCVSNTTTFNVWDNPNLYGCQSLNKTGQAYILKNDITSATTCFTLDASNLTFNGMNKLIDVTGDTTYAIQIPAAARTNITIKNANITIRGTSDAIGIYLTGNNVTVANSTINVTNSIAHGIYTSNYPKNITIFNNSIYVYGGSGAYGINLGVANSSEISNNNVTVSGSGSIGIALNSANRNGINNNNITSYGHGITIDDVPQDNEPSTFNTFLNNSVYVIGAGYGYYIANGINSADGISMGTAFNNITFGYVRSSTGYDIFLNGNRNASAVGTNRFIEQGFSNIRDIGLTSLAAKTTPYFYHGDDFSNGISLKTNFSGDSSWPALTVNLTRQTFSWSINSIKWSDVYKETSPSQYQAITNYNLSGLTPSWQYSFLRKNSTAGSKTGYMSDSIGALATISTIFKNSESSNMSIIKDTTPPSNITGVLSSPACSGDAFSRRANESVTALFNFIETGIISTTSSLCNMTDTGKTSFTSNPVFYSNPDPTNPDNYTYSCTFNNVGSLPGFASVKAQFNSTMNYSADAAAFSINVVTACEVQGAGGPTSPPPAPKTVERCVRDEDCSSLGVGKLCDVKTHKCVDKTTFRFILTPSEIITNPRVSTIIPGGAPYIQSILIQNDELRYTFTPQAKFECGSGGEPCLNDYCTFTSLGTIKPQTQGALTMTCAFPKTKIFPEKLLGKLSVYPKEFPLAGKALPITLTLSESESQKQLLLTLAEKAVDISNRDLTVSVLGEQKTIKSGTAIAASAVLMAFALFLML